MKLNPFTCMQLFDQALSKGFTSLDSYIMLREESEIITHAYEIMESSRKYSEQQLEYVSTMLTVKKMYDNMMASEALTSPYTAMDRKRLTIVTIEAESDDPLLGGHIMHFSENGMVQPQGDIALPQEYLKTLSILNDGDHLIRFLNIPFSMKYLHDMFIPVLLKGKEISPGS
jgi:hypothetical protein